jgi:hypothetical protein
LDGSFFLSDLLRDLPFLLEEGGFLRGFLPSAYDIVDIIKVSTKKKGGWMNCKISGDLTIFISWTA